MMNKLCADVMEMPELLHEFIRLAGVKFLWEIIKIIWYQNTDVMAHSS